MSDNFLSGKVALDTSDFKANVTLLNRELRVVESEFRANAAALGDWGNTANGLEARVKSLNSSIGLQAEKVNQLKNVYNQMAADGASQTQLQEQQIKINKATESLNKMENELVQTDAKLQTFGQENVKASQDVQTLGSKTDKTSTQMVSFKGVVTGVTSVIKTSALAVVGLAGAVAGVGVAVGKIAMGAASTSDELIDLSAKTGISTTRLQELSYAGTLIGTESETITGSMTKLTKSMADAKSPSSETAKAFKKLGVAVKDNKGNLLDNEVVFGKTIDALGMVKNETERDALAMKIFGKSAQELNPLIKAGSGELKKFSQEAHDMGAVMSEEDVAAAGSFQDQLDSLGMGFKGVVNQIGVAFIPAFSAIATKAGGYLKMFGGVVKSSHGDLTKMASGLSGLFGVIVQDVAASAPKMLQGGLAILQGVIDGIVNNLPAIGTAASKILESLFGFLVANIPNLLTIGSKILSGIASGIGSALSGLKDTAGKVVGQIQTEITNNGGLSGIGTTIINKIGEGITSAVSSIQTIFSGAFTQAATGSDTSLRGSASSVVSSIIGGITDNAPKLLQGGLDLLSKVMEGIKTNLPKLTGAALEIILGIQDGITASLPNLATAAGSIIGKIVEFASVNLPKAGDLAATILTQIVLGFNASISTLSSSGPAIIGEIIKAAQAALPAAETWAKNIVTAVVKGIQSNIGQLSDGARDIVAKFGESISALADQLNKIGKAIVDGVWKGIQAQAEEFKKQITGFFTGIVDAVKKQLGIKSPSTVFAGIGENMAAGLGIGFMEQISSVERQVQAATKGLSAGNANLAFAGAGNSSNTQYSTVNYYAPVINQNGGQSGSSYKTKRY